MEKYVCSVCGSEDIEVKAWVKANPQDEDLRVVLWCEDELCWCNKCRRKTAFKQIRDK